MGGKQRELTAGIFLGGRREGKRKIVQKQKHTDLSQNGPGRVRSFVLLQRIVFNSFRKLRENLRKLGKP